ncbi:MAG: helix-turn-helix domain-containing protein [Candidatus Micrarchaeota archaeon]|nr:helix-turn-helix domain-containing protein [Candidatus Micrarchaeota archaeon]
MNEEEFFLFLRKTGMFDKLELKVLQALMTFDRPVRASEIAKKCGMTVTNTYRYLYSLSKKGLVEYDKNSSKVFWLTGVNPFPRLFSYVSREYLEKKRIFKELERFYSSRTGEVWGGREKIERYSGIDEFLPMASYLLDAARDEVLIACNWFPDDIVLFDSMKRCTERGVAVKILTTEMDEGVLEILRKLGAEIRFVEKIIQPFIMVSDNRHGITVEMVKDGECSGLWFVNKLTDYRKKFYDLWEEAGEL